MEVADDALAVHRLVQAVVRDRLDEEGKKQWAGAVVEVVNDAFPAEVQSAVENWPWCARLLPTPRKSQNISRPESCHL